MPADLGALITDVSAETSVLRRVSPDRQHGQQHGAPQRAGCRCAHFPARQLDGRQLIKRGAPGHSICGPPGQDKGLLGRIGSNRIELHTRERLSGADPGFRGQLSGGERPGLGEQACCGGLLSVPGRSWIREARAVVRNGSRGQGRGRTPVP